MRPASLRTVVQWMCVPSLILAISAFAGSSLAQSRSSSRNRHPAGHSLLHEQTVTPTPARATAKTAVAPPNTTDSWTGGGDGTSWNNASNWNNGIPNSTTVDVTIGTATAAVNDNLTASVGNLTLSNAGDALTIQNGIALTVAGSNINNAGTITLGSSGNLTELVVGLSTGGTNTTLSGTGTLTLSNNANNYIFGAASTDTLTNHETIQGAGHIGNGQLTLVNSGTINANQSAGMTIQANGGVTNTGTIKATGGTLAFVSSTVTNAGGTISDSANTLQFTNSTVNGGNVTLTGASLLQLTNSTIHGGTLTNAAAGTIEVISNSTLGGTINNSGLIKVDNGGALTLESGTYSTLGAVQVNSTGNVTEFVVGTASGGQNVTLSGGSVTLSNNANNYIFGGTTTDTLTNQETISGAGHIGNGQLTLVNSGTINANASAGMIIQANGGVTNTGTIEATGGTLEFASSTVTNTGGTISDNANTLQLVNSTVNGGNVTLTGASLLQLTNSTIHGGTLTNSASGTIEVISNSTLGGTVSNAGLLKIDNGGALTLESGGSYSGLGTVQLNSTGNVSELILGTSTGGQNVTLSGGSVTMSNNANNYIFGGASTDTLTNQETISGAGHIGNGQLTLVNSGTINANASAGIIIQANGGVTNTGTIEATGGTLEFVNSTVANAGGKISDNANTLQLVNSTVNGGNVTLTGASTLQLTNSTIHGGTLTNASAGTIEVISNSTLGGTVNNAGLLKIDNGGALTLESGTYATLGTVTLNSTGNVSELVLGTSTGGQNVILTGGSVTLSNNANNYIFGGASTDTLTNQETISGAGHIGNGVLTLVNSGTINANASAGMIIQANGGVTNTGTIEATGGTLEFASSTVTNTGGTISDSANTLQLVSSTVNGGNVTLTGASTLQLTNSTIHGGTLTNAAAGTIEVISSSTLGGTVNNAGLLKIDNGGALTLESGSYATLGTVQLNSTGNVSELILGTSAGGQNVTLSGGSVTLSNNANNYIFGGTTTDTLTNQETISGAGHIGNGQLTLVNSGTINANASAGMIIQAAGGITNTGTIEATGGTLEIASSTVTNTGGTISDNANTLQLVNSTINGGTVTLTGASLLQLTNSTIHGGSTLTNPATGTIEVISSSTLGGTINNAGLLKIDNGGALTLESGAYATLGTVTLNSTGSLSELILGTSTGGQNVTLSGGSVTMSNNANNYIFGGATTDTLTNQETIQGAGHIGNGQLTLVNSGTINANQSAGIIIQANGGFTNSGTLAVSSGDLMHVVNGGTFTNFSGTTLTGGTYNIGGTLQIDQLGSTGGEIVTNAANIILNGTGSTFVDSASKDALTKLASNTATGSFTVSGGRTFTTIGNFSNLGTLNVGGSSSFTVTGTLAQISGTTLSGGTFILGGNLNVGSGINITTNSSTLTLAGGTIESGSNNALAGLASNTKSLTISGASNNISTTATTFSNTGTLNIGAGDSFNAKALTQLTGANNNKTLSAGTYVLTGNLNLSTSGLSITKNSATLTLAGGTINSNGVNALSALASNTKSLTIAGTGNNISTSAATFSNTGTLTINVGDSFTAPALTQIAGNTLTAGTYVLGGNLDLASAANITTNSASLTLEGGTIQTGTTNDLANLDTNTGTLVLALNANFSTVGGFTNSGTLTVNTGSKFTVTTGTLTNLSGGTLASGTYTIGGTLQLPSANGGIVTNAANLTLTGASAKILDGTANALAGFNNNTGTFALANAAKLTTAASNFTNSGTVTIGKGTTLTVPGTGHSYSQTAGTTTVDGTLAGILGGATFTGGTLQGAGSIRGNVSAGNATGNAVTINVGDAGKAGLLSITGSYTQLATGTMTGLVNGTAAGTGFSQLKVTGTASLAGSINFTVSAAFQPSLTVGETFTVLTAGSITGTFSNSTIAINSSFHFTVSYTSTGVVLTVASGAASAPASSPTTAQPAAQLAIATLKSVTAVAKPPVATSSLRHRINTTVARPKPVTVAGLRHLGGYSTAVVGTGWQRGVLRSAPVVSVISAGNRFPRVPIQAPRTPIVTSLHQTTTPSWNSGATSHIVSIAPSLGSHVFINRPVPPVRIQPMPMPVTRLGR